MGISKPVIKAHGSSDDYAMKNAIRQAVQFASSGIIEDITENIEYMRLPNGLQKSEGLMPRLGEERKAGSRIGIFGKELSKAY